MCLNEKKSMELYSVLEEKTLNYIIEGKEMYHLEINEKSGTEIKDVIFTSKLKQGESRKTELIYDYKIMSVKDKTTRQLFERWIKGSLWRLRLKGNLTGSDKMFVGFIEDLEKYSTWKYSGESELLMLEYKDGKLYFDDTMRFYLDNMIRDNVIVSVPSFFQQLVRICKKDNSLEKISNTFGRKN